MKIGQISNHLKKLLKEEQIKQREVKGRGNCVPISFSFTTISQMEVCFYFRS